MAWSFSMFFDSFRDPLPWIKDESVIAGNVQDSKTVKQADIWNPDFFYQETLHKSKVVKDADGNVSGGITAHGYMIGPLVLCMLLSYVCVYFSAWKGVKSTGKVAWVSCLLPYVVLLILLIKALTLEGCGDGLYYLFVPDGSKLGDISIWVAAAKQILFSSGVGYGPLMYYGGAREKDHKLLTVSYMIPILNSLTSIYAAITIFAFLGYAATQLGTPVDQVAKSGPDLLFVAFPALISLLHGRNFWAVIFFIMCACLGIDSVFGWVDFTVQYFSDQFPVVNTWMRKEYQVIVHVVHMFLWSLIFCNQAGMYSFVLFDDYAGHIQLWGAIILQLILIPWIVGTENLAVLIKTRTGETFPMWVQYVVKIFCPFIVFVVFILTWIYEFSPSTATDRLNDAGWTAGITWAGRLMWIIALVIMGVCACFPMTSAPHWTELVAEQYKDEGITI